MNNFVFLGERERGAEGARECGRDGKRKGGRQADSGRKGERKRERETRSHSYVHIKTLV